MFDAQDESDQLPPVVGSRRIFNHHTGVSIRVHSGTDVCITTTDVRVRYAETDQMGVAHHAVYLVWCELGRTQHMRELGVTYRALEESGIRLPVVDARLRFRSAARYDDLLSIRSWVRECASRRVQFGNAIYRGEQLLATAHITLIATNNAQSSVSIPREVRDRLLPTADPVRI